jgi:hypothetical protein
LGATKLDDYDVIVSNKSGFCHIIQHDENAVHICYCLTSTRYVWQIESYLEREGFGSILSLAVRPLIRLLRWVDYRGAPTGYTLHCHLHRRSKAHQTLLPS